MTIDPRNVYVENKTDETIPPYSVAVVIGVKALTEEKFPAFEIEKPSASNIDRNIFVITGRKTIGPSSDSRYCRGEAFMSYPIQVAVDRNDTVKAGDTIGPVEDKWQMGLSGAGFLVVAPDVLINQTKIKAAYDFQTAWVVQVVSGGGGTGLAKSPAGGIPARNSDIPGFATCNLAELYDASGTVKIREKSPLKPVLIYNTTSFVCAGSKWIHWKTEGKRKVVDVNDCGS